MRKKKHWLKIKKRKSCKWCFNFIRKRDLAKCKIFKWKRILFDEDLKIVFSKYNHPELDREFTLTAQKCKQFNGEEEGIIRVVKAIEQYF